MIEAMKRTRRCGPWPAVVAAIGMAVAACGSGNEVSFGSEAGDTMADTDHQEATTVDAADDVDADEDADDNSTSSTAAILDDAPADNESAEPLGRIDAPTVTIVDPGAEPRTELRFQLAEPVSGDMLLTQTQRIEQEIDGQVVPLPGEIALEFVSRLDATPSPDGLIELRSEITDIEPGAELSPAVAAQLMPAVREMIGSSSVSTIDERGRSTGLGMTWTGGGDQAALGVLEQVGDSSQLMVPFPEEAVGVGAVWEAQQRIPTSGVTIENTSRYTLESLDGDVATLSFESEQQVAPGSTMSVGGVSVNIESWSAMSTGSATLDLRSVFPSYAVTTRATQRLSAGQEMMSQTIESSITVFPG